MLSDHSQKEEPAGKPTGKQFLLASVIVKGEAYPQSRDNGMRYYQQD